MSPSESQLRAALHEGEGQNVDYGTLLAHAEGVRLARRNRINLAAAASVVVALVGVGTAALVSSSHSSGGGGSAASSNGQHRAAAGGAGSSAHGPATRQGGMHVENRAPCPPEAARIPAPAGRRGAGQPLFPAGVATITACGYPEGAAPRGAVLTGASARAVAAAIDRAPTQNLSTRPCPRLDYRVGSMTLRAVGADGRSAAPVFIMVNCAADMATNGTGMRSLMKLPPELAVLMR